MGGKEQDWSWLYARLQAGEDLDKEVGSFLQSGGKPTELLVATLGVNTMPDPRYKPKTCPRSLLRLLQAKADPNYVEPRMCSPVLHFACYSSTPKEVGLLLEHRADIEIGETSESGAPTPPLNSALAGGNALVVLELLKQRASCQWKHQDGATALHVAASWIADPKLGRSRKPPMGEEPVSVVKGLFHNGVDPLQREGMQGLTALDCFRSAMHTSPWLTDKAIGEEFKANSMRIMEIMLAADGAMKLKVKGAEFFAKKKFAETAEQWLAARKKLEAEGISGHHVAVLCSNLGNCYKNMQDFAKCRAVCEEGLAHYATGTIHTKLRHHLAECAKLEQASGYSAPAVPTAEQAPGPEAAGGGAAKTSGVEKDDAETKKADRAAAIAAAEKDAEDEEQTKKDKDKRRIKQEKEANAFKQGFLSDLGDEEMYGPEGSKQGNNLSELIKVTLGTNGPNGPPRDVWAPFGQVMPQIYDPNEGKKEEPDEYETTAKDC